MISKYLTLIVLAVLLTLSAFTGAVSPAFATQTPVFMSCVNPTGTVVSSYDSGTHGVVGDTASFSGKDTVYAATNGTNTQCLCTIQGQGIQTNWMKASNLSQDEISIYVNQGWTLIPNGSAWGLSDESYLAKNENYSCSGGSSSSEGRVGGASATSNVTTVLSLANTGNIIFIAGVFALGLGLLAAGVATSIKRKA